MILLVPWGMELLEDGVDERDVDDFQAVFSLLQGALEGIRGKIRVTDALALAGFERPSFHRTRIVTWAMRDLGWDRGRFRFNGALLYAYARGSLLDREAILSVERGQDDRLVVKRRAP